MTDDQLLWYATEFRAGFLKGGDSVGHCYILSEALLGALHYEGVRGLKIAFWRTATHDHYWIALDDGRVLDVTADQWNEEYGYDLPPVYLGRPGVIHSPPHWAKTLETTSS